MIDETKLKPFRPIGKRPIDWLKYSIRFVFGALFGALVGWILNSSPQQGYETILFYTMISGFISMVFGDRVWQVLWELIEWCIHIR